MIKLLIVDDFFYDRECAKEIIDWSTLGIEVVGACANGIEALELINELKPEIVFTDIDMPKLNGIELTREIKANYKNISVVFMSCHSDFRYAKEALKLDVSGYVTKPIEVLDVEEVFFTLVKKLNIQKELLIENSKYQNIINNAKELIKEKLITKIINTEHNKETILSELEAGNLSNFNTKWKNILFKYETIKDYEDDEEREFFNTQTVKIFSVDLDEKYKCIEQYFITKSNDLKVLVINSTKLSLEEIDEYITYLRNELNKLNICITMIVGEDIDDILELRESYKRCKKALNNKFIFGKGSLIYENMKITDDSDISLDNLYEDLVTLLTEEDNIWFNNFMDKYFIKSTKMTREYLYVIITEIIKNTNRALDSLDISAVESYASNIGWIVSMLPHATLDEVKLKVYRLLLQIKNDLLEIKSNKYDKKVLFIKEYVEKNYNSQLTLQSIADEMYFSPNYLNSIFIKEINVTIPDYIEDVRINKAKELLHNSDLKLYEIVESVGYKHLPYFNKLFKKHTGLTPKEFRKLV